MGLVLIKICGDNILFLCVVDNVGIKSLFSCETKHMEVKDLLNTCFLEPFQRNVFENNYLKTHRTLFRCLLKSVVII